MIPQNIRESLKVKNNHVRQTVTRIGTFQCLVLFSVLVLCPTVTETMSVIARSFQNSLLKKYLHFKNLQAANIGEEVLPIQAREVIGVLRQNKLENFSLAPSLRDEVLVLQRISEGAWPLQYNENSSHQFFSVSDSLPINCELQATVTMVKYAICH